MPIRSGLSVGIWRAKLEPLASVPLLVATTAHRWRRGHRAVIARLGLAPASSASILTPAERRRVQADESHRLTASVVARRPRALAPNDPGIVAGLRVLHVVGTALPQVQAGSTLRTHAVLRAQRQLGIDASAATAIGFPVVQGILAGPTDVVDGIPYRHLLPALRPGRSARDYAALLIEHVRITGTQLLHATTDYANGRAAIAAASELGLPFVYEVRGFLEESRASRESDATATERDHYRLARQRESEVMRAADIVITLGQGMREEIISRGVDESRVHLVPNGVDEHWLEPVADPRIARTHLGLIEHDITIGVITTVHAFEGIPMLVDACALARRQGIDVGLVVVGTGPAIPRVRAAARPHPWVHIAGRVPHVSARDWFDAIDLLAVPRQDHRVTRLVTPMKPLEALARGRGVLASDLPALREVTGGHARFVPAGDLTAWVEAIGALANDREREEIAAAGRSWVNAHRRWGSTCGAYLPAYASVLNGER